MGKSRRFLQQKPSQPWSAYTDQARQTTLFTVSHTDKENTLCHRKQARAQEGGEAGSAFFGVALVRAGLVKGQNRWDAPCGCASSVDAPASCDREMGSHLQQANHSLTHSLRSSLHGLSSDFDPLSKQGSRLVTSAKKSDMAKERILGNKTRGL